MTGVRGSGFVAVLAAFVALSCVFSVIAVYEAELVCCEVAEFDSCLIPGSTPTECETASCTGYVVVPCSESAMECYRWPGPSIQGSAAQCAFEFAGNIQPRWAVEGLIFNEWDWTGLTGPTNWGKAPQFSLCETGREQSPINVVTGSPSIVGAAPGSEQTIGDVASHGPATYITSQSRGAPTYDCATPQTCGSTTYNGQTYFVIQFHFHEMSENAIDGRTYAMELHAVHQNPDNGALLVIGILLDMTGDIVNPALANVLSAETVASSGLSIEFDLSAVYDASSGFYNWAGSLTTPPCSEGVTWILSKTKALISQSQWQSFWDHIGGYPGDARDWQPLNGRTILDSMPSQ